MYLKLLQKGAAEKTAEVTGDLTGNNIADKITTVSKTSLQNNWETNKEEILIERYISPIKRQKIIDGLGLM